MAITRCQLQNVTVVQPTQRTPAPGDKATWSRTLLAAEPLDLDHKHAIIRRVHQERDPGRRRWYCTGSAITTASMNTASDARGRRQVGELLLSRAI